MASAQNLALGPFLLRTDHLIFERHALGIVFRKPSFRGVSIRKDLDVLGVADLLAGVDVDKTVIGLSSGAIGGILHRAALMSLNL
jgi:hypothetical protein